MVGVARARISDPHQIRFEPHLLRERQKKLVKLLRKVTSGPGIIQQQENNLFNWLNSGEITSLDILLICDVIAGQSTGAYIYLKPKMPDILRRLGEEKLKEVGATVNDCSIALHPNVSSWFRLADKPALTLVPSPQKPQRKSPSKTKLEQKTASPSNAVESEGATFFTREGEVHLFMKLEEGLKENKDVKKITAELVACNQGLVCLIANKYQGKGLMFEDLIQEGNIGLLEAIKKFDYRLGYKFSTYATWWIKQNIQRALMDKGDEVRKPIYVHDFRRKVRKFIAEFQKPHGGRPTNKEIAEALAKNAKEEKQIIKRLETYDQAAPSMQQPACLDAPVNQREADSSSLHGFVSDVGAVNPEKAAILRTSLLAYLDVLKPGPRRILELSYGLAPEYPGEEMNLREIAPVVGLGSPERVRQIRNAALAELRDMQSNLRTLVPHAKWLNDKEALDLMKEELSPEERNLFNITFEQWVCDQKAAELLEESGIGKLRKALKAKLDELYDIVQDAGLDNIGSGRDLKVLLLQKRNYQQLLAAADDFKQANPSGKYIPVNEIMETTGFSEWRITKLIQKNEKKLKAQGIEFRSSRRGDEKRDYRLEALRSVKARLKNSIAAGREIPQICNLEDLAREMDVAYTSICNWQREFGEEIRSLVREIIEIGQAVDKERKNEKLWQTLLEKYELLVPEARDLGRNPVGIPELAAALGHDATTVRNQLKRLWSKIESSAMVLYLRQGYPQEYMSLMKYRRLLEALNNTKAHSYTYSSPKEFAKERLSLSRDGFKLWIVKDQSGELDKIFARFSDEDMVRMVGCNMSALEQKFSEMRA